MQYQITKLDKTIAFFIFSAVVIISLFFIFNIKESRLFKKQMTLYTNIDKGYGFVNGTPVKINGIVGGVVDDVKLEQNNTVTLCMKIYYPYYKNIHQDAAAEIIEPLALGSTEINILPGSIDKILAEEGDSISSRKPTSLATKLEASVGQIESTLSDFHKTSEKVYKISENLESITDKIDKGSGSLGQLINDPTLYNDLKATVSSTKTVSEELQKVTLSVESITRKIDKGEGSLGKMVNDPALYDTARDTVESTRSIVESIKTTKIFVGGENDFYYKQDVNITKFHLKVVPRESRYFWLGGAIFNPASNSKITMEEDVEHSYKAVTELMIAQKIFDNQITLRGGLLEGQAGGGIDFVTRSPLAEENSSDAKKGEAKYKDIWRWSIEGRDTFDAKDFNENLHKPLLRIKTRLNISQYFHIELGGDNLLNDAAFFIGIGFEYMDEDISKIVGLVGAGK
jgi:phospholipid/cholesterol/gamma-HCH transport system substrate-binding protein